MSPTSLPTHPDDRDLRNFAREELGERKKERILAHCRDCADCADRLIEATREYAPAPERRPLSRWQWASIVLFVVALAVAVGAVVWLLRTVSSAPGLREPAVEGPEIPAEESGAPAPTPGEAGSPDE